MRLRQDLFTKLRMALQKVVLEVLKMVQLVLKDDLREC